MINKALKLMDWARENDYWASLQAKEDNVIIFIYPADDDLERWTINLKEKKLFYGLKISEQYWSVDYEVTENEWPEFERYAKPHIEMIKKFDKIVLDSIIFNSCREMREALLNWQYQNSEFELFFPSRDKARISLPKKVDDGGLYVWIDMKKKRTDGYFLKQKEESEIIFNLLDKLGVIYK